MGIGETSRRLTRTQAFDRQTTTLKHYTVLGLTDTAKAIQQLPRVDDSSGVRASPRVPPIVQGCYETDRLKL